MISPVKLAELARDLPNGRYRFFRDSVRVRIRICICICIVVNYQYRLPVNDSHIASATAATVHAAVQATASASQIAAVLRCGSSGSSSVGVGSSGRTSPSGGTCTCFISRSPRVGNTRRRRVTQLRARNHADLSRAGLHLRTRLSRPSALEHTLAAIESAPIARAA